MNIKTPPARRKQREERVVDRATDSFQMDKEISLGVDKKKSLKWNMNNSSKTNKEKSSKNSKEKSLETLWQEVQALDSSPRRPSSLSTQVYISRHQCNAIYESSTIIRYLSHCVFIQTTIQYILSIIRP